MGKRSQKKRREGRIRTHNDGLDWIHREREAERCGHSRYQKEGDGGTADTNTTEMKKTVIGVNALSSLPWARYRSRSHYDLFYST